MQKNLEVYLNFLFIINFSGYFFRFYNLISLFYSNAINLIDFIFKNNAIYYNAYRLNKSIKTMNKIDTIIRLVMDV